MFNTNESKNTNEGWYRGGLMLIGGGVSSLNIIFLSVFILFMT